MKKNQTMKLVYAAICLALCLVLPFLTMQIPTIGKALSPMHIPVFLCGFLCGWPYAIVVGFIAPLLRSVMFGMPAMVPDALGMAFELAAYGVITGVLFRLLPRKTVNIYVTLICAMLGGRVVWGIAKFLITKAIGMEFPFSAWLAGGFINAVPGIILHIVLVPVIVIALQKAHLIPEDRD